MAEGAARGASPARHLATVDGSRERDPFEAHEVERRIEALLFAAAEPVAEATLAARAGGPVGPALARLAHRYEGRGVSLRQVAGGWAFRTAPDLAPWLAAGAAEERRLSRAAVETLAVIAYHGPVTRAEIEEVRGVAAARGTLDLLIDLGWVRMGRRRATPGRPATFQTTPAFLDHFGLASAADLPGLEELRAAGFLSGPEGRPAAGAGGAG